MVNIVLQEFLNVITTNFWLGEFSLHVQDMIVVMKNE